MQIDELSSAGQVDASQGDYLEFLALHVFLVLNIIVNILCVFDGLQFQIESVSEPFDHSAGLLELLVLVGLTGENVVVFLTVVDVDQIDLGVLKKVDRISDSSWVVVRFGVLGEVSVFGLLVDDAVFLDQSAAGADDSSSFVVGLEKA
jgi:hypothetical protein